MLVLAAHLAVDVLWGDYVAPDLRIDMNYYDTIRFLSLFTIVMGAQISIISDVRTR